jgi:hypothetical protein
MWVLGSVTAVEKSASIAIRVDVSSPILCPVRFATISATRRQCAGVRPAWVVPAAISRQAGRMSSNGQWKKSTRGSDAGTSRPSSPAGSGDRVAVQTEAVDGRRDPKPKTKRAA